ncbi:WYL domain-containing protein [Chitinophaga silvatica]|uniref:WYL domain-containing protein n=1 Tax=Chitinophaga silvatica TaxID=2282649 RepID=A0A3E1Y994_9BACT|nr:WYL domain-containing protein [Chitinophaga silvatica]RFS21975.1 WYL domain-containing protein [Chitinophaga silvatica]
MSINKLALIRYKTIDQCLRNRYRKWTLEDLIEKVGEVLYDYEGISTGVSKRTIQADIQIMRSDRLGYNAPIIVKDKKYYAYDDPNYSITNSPISEADLDKFKEIVGVLKELNGFQYFGDMSETITRLESNLNTEKGTQNCIQFENNHQLKGLSFINTLYQSILNKKTLLITYQSFTAVQQTEFLCYPYLLKEYRNRWFLIVKCKGVNMLMTMALDRIISIQEKPKEKYIAYNGIPFEEYYSDLIGVSKSEKDLAKKIVLQIDKSNAPYVITKPLHASQKVLKKETDGSIILSIHVVVNFELEREILGFGEHIKVLSPSYLATRISKRLLRAAIIYKK